VAYVDHGVNFGGSLNFFGGWSDQWEHRLSALVKAKTVYSLDISMPDYAGIIEKRKDVNLPALVRALQKLQARSKKFSSLDLDLEWATIGDSHTAAWTPPGSMFIKEYGNTLHGQLSRDFPSVRMAMDRCSNLKGLTLVYGNIDVRFHLLRLGIDWREMWREYKKFGDSLGIEVEYAIPWPIEFEQRRIPKTGYYKGHPFYGSCEERAKLVEDIISFSEEIGMNIVQYPSEWRQEDPETYAKNRMEKPGSVHLAPTMYRRNNWGIQS